jgi:hypothetical protein
VVTPAVTSVASVKTYMQLPETGSEGSPVDAVIEQLIPQISALFKKYTGRVFGTYEYTEFYSGDGTPVLVLRQRPVTPEGLLVWVDDNGAWGQGTQSEGPFPASSLQEEGTYALDLDDGDLSGSGLLYRVNSVWPMAKTRLWLNQSPDLAANYRYPTGNIKVQYTAGELPDDVELAANMTIAAILRGNRTGVPIQSVSYEDFSMTLSSFQTSGGLLSAIPPQALAILAGYRELAF